MNNLLQEIEKWSVKYEFSFQFWGEGNNNVFVEKDGVELYSSGGHETIAEAIYWALDYIYRINRTTLTLPRDWDKLIEYTKREEKQK